MLDGVDVTAKFSMGNDKDSDGMVELTEKKHNYRTRTWKTHRGKAMIPPKSK